MDLAKAVKNELNSKKTLTDNGAIAYQTSGKELLDFNFNVSSMRFEEDESSIIDNFIKVYAEDPKTAIKYLFFVGDIREGLGERKVFKACFKYLASIRPDIANAVLYLIPEYNRWDSLIQLIEIDTLKDNVVNIIRKQFFDDLRGALNHKNISLLGKWMPSENTSSSKTRALARKVRTSMGLNSANYRKGLSKLRSYLNVVETQMSANKWEQIDYEKVPSKANLIYKNAFLKHDEERRTEFLNSLSKGTAKINSGTLDVHEIVRKYNHHNIKYTNTPTIDEALENMWNSLPSYSVENSLIIRDGSGSMMWGEGRISPLDVATALSIYTAQHNTGPWKNKYITFSSNPEIVDLSKCNSLAEALNLSYYYDDCSNTDIYRTMRLILDVAVKNKMNQSDMPSNIIICSDMQFDGNRFNFNESLFDSIAREYKENGYNLPKICFWNLNQSFNKTIPMQSNEFGLILCSGFSLNLLKMVMSNNLDPYKALTDIINSKRYEAVENEICKFFTKVDE